MKKEQRFVNIISYTFLILMITFFISTFMIGGDALSGKKENNKYYVWDAIHKYDTQGRALYLEVSKSVYTYSLTLNYLLFLILPVFLFFKIREYILNRKESQRN
jgi:lipopolysaccharide export system protein LptC